MADYRTCKTCGNRSCKQAVWSSPNKDCITSGYKHWVSRYQWDGMRQDTPETINAMSMALDDCVRKNLPGLRKAAQLESKAPGGTKYGD